MTSDPRAILKKIPGFHDANFTLTRAAGQSLNNELWRVSVGSRVWALRVAQAEDALGIDRGHETAASVAAADAGVSPAVVHEHGGVLLLDWIEGRTLSDADFAEEGVRRIARLLRAAHVRAPRGLPTLADRVEGMLARAVARGAQLPDGLESALERVRAAEPARAVLTHHDVWPNNVMDDGDRLWLVDWEFAGAGDGMFDLATVARTANLTAEGEDALLEEYGAPGASRRLAEARWSVGLFEGAWALAMHTVRGSDGPFDYVGHARQMFAELSNAPDSAPHEPHSSMIR
ncbi:phosphotransferase family protein [Agromyces sp. ISL-38]|uniref:choline/ethanolamine kinase family protein n=1 Tax=Agromyces sp. ISL-38 TaxID=2819107 RepID=UPI001BE51A7B|nr:choline/ethanolamine kinase family protein [Agromyces sp. ISL-38]MBT2498064.1 phosphotransferase family protein [Agromyces sp. ISL-38]